MYKQYFEEGQLVEMFQSGKLSMHGYVTHHSKEWDQEYDDFCAEQGLDSEEESSAEAFLSHKDEQLTAGMLEGEA